MFLNKLVSAELECKSVYLAAFVSAFVFVDCVRGCLPDCVYMSKFACNSLSWMGWVVCWEWWGGAGSASQCTPCLGLMKD